MDDLPPLPRWNSLSDQTSLHRNCSVRHRFGYTPYESLRDGFTATREFYNEILQISLRAVLHVDLVHRKVIVNQRATVSETLLHLHNIPLVFDIHESVMAGQLQGTLFVGSLTSPWKSEHRPTCPR